jgi:hypothetical protein
MPIQACIFFSCYFELSNELFHYKTNICTWAIVLLLLLLTTLEESLNFIIFFTLLRLHSKRREFTHVGCKGHKSKDNINLHKKIPCKT